jgi:hypothetical protein
VAHAIRVLLVAIVAVSALFHQIAMATGPSALPCGGAPCGHAAAAGPAAHAAGHHGRTEMPATAHPDKVASSIHGDCGLCTLPAPIVGAVPRSGWTPRPAALACPTGRAVVPTAPPPMA